MDLYPNNGIASGSPVAGISNAILVANSASALAGVAYAATGQVLISQGAASAPAFSATPKFLTWGSSVADGAAAVAHISDTDNTFANATSKLHSFRNNTVEKASIGYDGKITTGVGGLGIRQTNDALTADITVLSGVGFYNATVPLAMDIMNQASGTKTITHGSSSVVFNGGAVNYSFTPNTQAGLGSGNFGKFYFKAPSDTARQASQQVSEFYFDMNRSITWSTGALTELNAFNILAPTYAFNGASTVDDASTFTIDRAPQAGANATLTRTSALRVKAGDALFEGRVRRPAAQTQTTVGAAGLAAVLPALPLGYFKYKVDGTEVAVPYYTA